VKPAKVNRRNPVCHQKNDMLGNRIGYGFLFGVGGLAIGVLFFEEGPEAFACVAMAAIAGWIYGGEPGA
jgi:hypothetical protein